LNSRSEKGLIDSPVAISERGWHGKVFEFIDADFLGLSQNLSGIFGKVGTILGIKRVSMEYPNKPLPLRINEDDHGS
jgi:hypothetical protein